MKTPSILIVDDQEENIEVLYQVLKDDYKVQAATNGAIALEIAKGYNPDLILLDVVMPEMDGFMLCSRLKTDPLTKNIPVIFVTSIHDEVDEAYGLQIGAVDYIQKPISPMIVKARVTTHLSLADQKRTLSRTVHEKTRELEETRRDIIHILGRASEYKDNETGTHVIRMSKYCYEIAVQLGLDRSAAELLRTIAPMHDVGKIGIPDKILEKQGRLNASEWEIMKQHTWIGYRILGDHKSELLRLAQLVALEHHEWVNGNGYPKGIRGDQIHLFSRIVAVSDVFDALIHERPYKEAWTMDDAVDFIVSKTGSQFDEEVVNAFLRALPKIVDIARGQEGTSDSEGSIE